MNDKEKLAEIEENRRKIPPIDNLPKGEINWAEIGAFVLNEMTLGNGSLNWLILGSSSETEMLSENSLMVLKLLESDMYDFFFHRNVELDRSGQWNAMESYIRQKYGALPEKALKKLFSDYKINDR